jgi:hypothetical protein
MDKDDKIPVRLEKIEEIRSVWSNPEFKTNREKLIHLFKDCKKVEEGYTTREFANAIFPEKMIIPSDQEESNHVDTVTKYLERMLKTFGQDVINHRIVLSSKYVDGVYYYYNMVEDSTARDLVKGAKTYLGIEKKINQSFETFERRKPNK